MKLMRVLAALLLSLSTAICQTSPTQKTPASSAQKPKMAAKARTAKAVTSSPAKGDVEQRVNAILGKMTLEEKIDLLGGVEGFYIPGNDRVGIKRVRMADGPMGVRNFGYSTAYPAGIGLARAWEADLTRRIGGGFGEDRRAKGANMLLAPGMNYHSRAVDGMHFES